MCRHPVAAQKNCTLSQILNELHRQGMQAFGSLTAWQKLRKRSTHLRVHSMSHQSFFAFRGPYNVINEVIEKVNLPTTTHYLLLVALWYSHVCRPY
jgi:hypothetical protein